MYFKVRKKTLILFLLSMVFVWSVSPVFAQKSCAEGGPCSLKDSFKTGDGSNADPLDGAASSGGYDTAKEKTSPDFIIETVIQTALSFLGVVFTILIVYGGYLWMAAQGNEEQVIKAKNLMTAATTGLVIVISAYAISYFVLSELTVGTGILTAPPPTSP